MPIPYIRMLKYKSLHVPYRNKQWEGERLHEEDEGEKREIGQDKFYLALPV